MAGEQAAEGGVAGEVAHEPSFGRRPRDRAVNARVIRSNAGALTPVVRSNPCTRCSWSTTCGCCATAARWARSRAARRGCCWSGWRCTRAGSRARSIAARAVAGRARGLGAHQPAGRAVRAPPRARRRRRRPAGGRPRDARPRAGRAGRPRPPRRARTRACPATGWPASATAIASGRRAVAGDDGGIGARGRRRPRRRAADQARERVEHDPFSEAAVRELVRLTWLAGDRAGALDVYDRFRERLRSERGVAPSPETRRLIDELRAGRDRPDAAAPGAAAGGARARAAASPLVGRESTSSSRRAARSSGSARAAPGSCSSPASRASARRGSWPSSRPRAGPGGRRRPRRPRGRGRAGAVPGVGGGAGRAIWRRCRPRPRPP